MEELTYAKEKYKKDQAPCRAQIETPQDTKVSTIISIKNHLYIPPLFEYNKNSYLRCPSAFATTLKFDEASARLGARLR